MKIRNILSCISLIAVCSCDVNETGDSRPTEATFAGRAPNSIGTVMSDKSGLVETVVSTCFENSTHGITVECDVPNGFVLVGGGGSATWTNPGTGGALLTASYPKDLKTWVVTSKDHMYPQSHTTTSYAIGMRLRKASGAGYFDPAELAARMQIFKATNSPKSATSDITVDVPAGYRMLGGGAKANYTGAGALLVYSYPKSSSQWRAASKDNYYSDPNTVTAYAIGIQNTLIPDFGYIVTTIPSSEGIQVGGNANAEVSIAKPYGWALTSIGGKSDGARLGRYFTQLTPVNGGLSVKIVTKDHIYSDAGFASAYVIAVQNSPTSTASASGYGFTPHKWMKLTSSLTGDVNSNIYSFYFYSNVPVGLATSASIYYKLSSQESRVFLKSIPVPNTGFYDQVELTLSDLVNIPFDPGVTQICFQSGNAAGSFSPACFNLRRSPMSLAEPALLLVSQPGYLNEGSFLFPGEFIQVVKSATSGYYLIMQHDGNLVIRDYSMTPVWSTGTAGNPGSFLEFGSDGLVRVKNLNGGVLWTTDATQYRGRQLILQADANLVLYDLGPLAWWSWKTGKIR